MGIEREREREEKKSNAMCKCETREKKKQIFARNIERFPIESLSHCDKIDRNFAHGRRKFIVVAW